MNDTSTASKADSGLAFVYVFVFVFVFVFILFIQVNPYRRNTPSGYRICQCYTKCISSNVIDT
jgi:hypothetical protein